MHRNLVIDVGHTQIQGCARYSLPPHGGTRKTGGALPQPQFTGAIAFTAQSRDLFQGAKTLAPNSVW